MKLQGLSASGVRRFVARFGAFVFSERGCSLAKGGGRFPGKEEETFPGLGGVSWATARARFLDMKLQGLSASGVRRFVRFGGVFSKRRCFMGKGEGRFLGIGEGPFLGQRRGDVSWAGGGSWARARG